MNAETIAIDLGEVVITPIPVLVAGVVRDAEGGLVENVGVGVHRWAESRHIPKGRSEIHGALKQTRTDASGAFRIIGSGYGDRLVVTASRGGFEFAISSILEPGTEGLELTLRETGVVHGSISNNTPNYLALWDIALVPAGRIFPGSLTLAASEPGAYSVFHVRGGFGIKDVVPGTYDLHLYHGELGGCVLTIPTIEVPVGDFWDPRLKTLNPFASLKTIQLTVNGPDGEPVDVVLVLAKLREPKFVRSQDGSEYEAAPWCEVGLLQHGQGEVTMYEPELHLSIRAEGYETLEVEHVKSDLTVQLKKGMQVQIELDEPIDLTGTSGPNRLLVSISPVDNSMSNHIRSVMASAYQPLVDGTCNLEIGQLGKHQVLLMLETEYGTPRRRLYPLIWSLIVPDIAGPGDVITIAPPQEWIAKKLAKE